MMRYLRLRSLNFWQLRQSMNSQPGSGACPEGHNHCQDQSQQGCHDDGAKKCELQAFQEEIHELVHLLNALEEAEQSQQAQKSERSQDFDLVHNGTSSLTFTLMLRAMMISMAAVMVGS